MDLAQRLGEELSKKFNKPIQVNKKPVNSKTHTSLAYVIGLKEFLRRVNLTDQREFRSVELYLFAAVVYLFLCSLEAALSSRLERRRSTGASWFGGKSRGKALLMAP